MSKFSKKTVDKISATCILNMTDKIKRRVEIPLRVVILNEMCKIPLNKDIVGRYLALHQQINNRKRRILVIADELKCLWKKFNFPVLSEQTVIYKINQLVDLYVNYRKRKNDQFQTKLQYIYDITKLDGIWLSMEDKNFYQKQIESQGELGYTTAKVAPISSIHPSKRRYVDKIKDTGDIPDIHDESQIDDDIKSSFDDDYYPDIETKKKIYQNTNSAAKLVTQLSLSTKQASGVCRTLAAEESIELCTPSQSGIWRRIIKEGGKKISIIQNLLNLEKNFCLHFDGKRISKKEYQVVCLKSPSRSINLGIVLCKSVYN